MNAYADTGFLVSLYGRDDNSAAAAFLVQNHLPSFFLTPLGEAEFTNALELRVFRGQWAPAEARAVRDDFLSDVGAGVLRIEDLPSGVWQLALSLSRRRSAQLGTRTLDVLHVASALLLKPEAFFTFDERQWKLARAEGLRALPARFRIKER